MRLMSKGEYLIIPKGMKFTGSGKLGLNVSFPGGTQFFSGRGFSGLDFRSARLAN